MQPSPPITMTTMFRWILPLAVLAGCSLESEEPPEEVDLDVVAILGSIVDHMNAEGDSVRVLQGVFCSTDMECEELEANVPDASSELEAVSASTGIALVFNSNMEAFPPCGWSDVGGEAEGFIVLFERPKIAGDSAAVTAVRFCVQRPRRSTYGQADQFELLREGSGWRVAAVHGIWET